MSLGLCTKAISKEEKYMECSPIEPICSRQVRNNSLRSASKVDNYLNNKGLPRLSSVLLS